jgi:hypothetical protein
MLVFLIGFVGREIGFFRYVVDDRRVLFLLQDGSQTYDVKDYLIQQDRCEEVTIDNRPYYGKGAKVSRIYI